VTTTATTSVPVAASRPESGARSGAYLAASAFVATGLNYVFLLAAGRILGKDDYGALAALLGLLTVVLLPTGGIQLAVSREVSRLIALGDDNGAAAFSRATLRLGLIATLPLVGVSLALTIPLRDVLNIDSTGPVALAVAGLAIALAYPVATGILQGYQRFQSVAALSVVPFALRLLLLALAGWLGYRLGGAVLAAAGGGILSALLALALLREPLRRGAHAARPKLGPFLRYLWPVVVGLIGIAVVTNLDLLVVKARFSDEAGTYAAASAFARVAFFLPATILAVLFPRTAARQVRGDDAADILGRTFLVTAGFGGLLAVFYSMTGRGLVATSFGTEYAAGDELVVSFTLSMALFALVNVLVGYHLSRDETRYAWIVAAAIPLQLVVLGLIPNDAQGVIWADLIIGAGLLCAHEIFVDSSVPALGAGARLLGRELRLARRALGEAAVVLLGTTAFVCLLFWPLVEHFGSTVIGQGSDATGGIWTLWQMRHESGYHLFGTTHHTLTGAPFGWDGDNGLNIQWLLPYYGAYLATAVFGEVAASNLLLLSGYVLSGASMYLLVRYLGCNRLVAIWAGLVFVVFPWHLERTPHPSLTHLEFLPLTLLALVALARKPSWARYLLVGVATLACWLTSGYFGVMAVVAAVAFAAGAVVTALGRKRMLVLGGAIGAAIAATLLVAFLSAISGVGRGSGLHRVADDLAVYGLRPLELVVPAAHNLLLGHWFSSFWDGRQHRSNLVETPNYLGLLTMALAVAWVVFAWKRRGEVAEHLRLATVGFVAVIVVAFALALPSPVSLFGHDVWMPSRVLWTFVPPFRVPSRWVVLLMAALVPLAALALQEGWARLASRRVTRRGIPLVSVAVVGAAMVFSFLELAVNPSRDRFDAAREPTEYSALARTPPGVLAEYPLVENIDYLFWQRLHHRPVLNTSAFGSPADDARRVVLDPRTPGTAGKLAFLGVTAIVTHRDALSYTDRVPDVPGASWGAGYRLVTRTSDGSSVWRVVAPPAPALVTMHSGFGEPRPPAGDRIEFPLISPAGVGYFEIRTKDAGTLRLTFEAAPPKGTKRLLRIADAETEIPVTLEGRTRVSVVVDVPSGLSLLLVKTDPAATSTEDAIELTAPNAQRSPGEPQLHAQPISPDIGF
jgi:O-antigen/teichoic acid export membrane protein